MTEDKILRREFDIASSQSERSSLIGVDVNEYNFVFMIFISIVRIISGLKLSRII